MHFTISTLDVFVRDIPPPRMEFAIGKGQSLFPEWMRVNLEVRLTLTSDDGRESFGCSADWPSFGWLDKRPDVDPKIKFKNLLQLVLATRDSYASLRPFKNPFDAWWEVQSNFSRPEISDYDVPLCNSFCLAIFERALIDAFCRINGLTFFEAIKQNRLGFQPEKIHSELRENDFPRQLPQRPLDLILIRHTIGPNDPILSDEVEVTQRLEDGLSQTLQEYISNDGIRCFKIKIVGRPAQDLIRLQNIWHVVRDCNPSITLDGNEAYDNIFEFQTFVDALVTESPDLAAKIRFIEQPLNRATTFDEQTKNAIKVIAEKIPLIIDEADGYLQAFADAIELGYQGVSHKNCKGIFKSLANFALACQRNEYGAELFQSAEDLTSLPPVALQQDFVVVGALGLSDAERNGHHFFAGLSHLTFREKKAIPDHYAGLYRETDGEWYLNIDQGTVDISCLNAIPGLGVAIEPDWASMTPLKNWLEDL